jgi:transcriptional regulator with XRE-family HTH domain
MLFGEQLRTLRERAGLSQSALAQASGIPLWTLRGYEQGRREPLWVVLFKLADALGVPVEAFRACPSREGDKHVRKQARGFLPGPAAPRSPEEEARGRVKKKRRPRIVPPAPTYRAVPLTHSRHNTFLSRCRLLCERCAQLVAHVDATFGAAGLSAADVAARWPGAADEVARHPANCRPTRSRTKGEVSA